MNEKAKVDYQYPKGNGCGFGIGCFAIGCFGFVLIFFGAIFGVYYAAMHTNLPLSIAEAALEDSGDVEIEGLEGSVSSGFKAEKFRFRTTDENWSSLNDIRFEYEQDSSWFGDSELVIREMSIGSGEIYADFGPDEMKIDFDGEIRTEFDEIQEEIKDAEREMEVEFGESFDGFEFRIETVSVSDLKLINPDKDIEITVNEISFKDFKFKDGRIVSFGELVVDSSQIDVETQDPERLVALENAQRYQGVAKQSTDQRLKQDIPFSIEFGVDDDFEFQYVMEVFEQQVQVTDVTDEYSLTLKGFSQNEWFDFENNSTFFSNMSMKVDFDPDNSSPAAVSDDASCMFGTKRFGNFVVQQNENGMGYLSATTIVDGESATLTFSITPFGNAKNVKLDSEDVAVWSQVLYGKSENELSVQEQKVLFNAMNIADETEGEQPGPSEAEEAESPAEAETEQAAEDSTE